VFPPIGVAYRDSAESHALWRWVGIHAPDLVLIAGPDESSLSLALSRIRLPASADSRAGRRGTGLLEAVPATIAESEAHHEINGRLRRSPRQVADELSRIYGQDFDQFTTSPAWR
jgi:hypothetical protein